MLSCFLAELEHIPLLQKLFHEVLAQLLNCFFLLLLFFSAVLLSLLGNQFVSCGMDWSIDHFDAFSHTKYFIHNLLRIPAPEEDVVGPSHGERDELLQSPALGPALRAGGPLRLRGGAGYQVPGVPEQEFAAVAPVFVGFVVGAQRLHPGGRPRVLAQELRHLLRHVGLEGRGGREPAPQQRKVRGRAACHRNRSQRPSTENAPREARNQNHKSPSY